MMEWSPSCDPISSPRTSTRVMCFTAPPGSTCIPMPTDRAAMRNIPIVFRRRKKGLFGEVMAGLMTQAYQFVGGHQWSIPIFLFRYHAEVEAYIFDLARDPTRVGEISGRHGNDFIALGIDPATGQVVRFIAGEAKWRASLTPSVMDEMMLGGWTGPPEARVRSNDGVWNELNRGLSCAAGPGADAPTAVREGTRAVC